MSKPFSRQLLADYCLRSLGAPVIEINLDDDQIDDRIDESIQFYQEYHNDAIIRTFRKHQIAAADLQNKYIKLPQSLLFVKQSSLQDHECVSFVYPTALTFLNNFDTFYVCHEY